MRKHIQLWGTRTFLVVAIVFVAQHWGTPLYKQYFSNKKTAPYIPTTTVKKGDIVISFHEIGTLDSERSVSVTTETGGSIISLVPDGTVVKPGDVLVVLDTSEILRDVRNAQLTYENALADIVRAQSELEILKKSNATEVAQAKAQLDFDKAELDQAIEQLNKKKRLAEDKLIPGDQVNQADLEVRSKELAVAKGEMALDLKKKDVESKERQKEADIRKVQFAADIAKSGLAEVQNRVKKATITAPAGGLVVITKTWTGDGERRLQEGDSTRPRQTICNLPDLSSMRVKVQVGESDAPKVKLNMPVVIRLEAVPNKVYHGTVKEISRLATEANFWQAGATPGRKNFEVTIAIKETDPKTLNPGMTTNVEFICDRITKVNYAPLEAIVERSGKTYVFVKKGSKFERVEVVTGKSNDNFICIKKGLSKGQAIALRDPTKSLDDQEAGTKTVNTDQDKKKKPAPIPTAVKGK
jgi:RND family efflux transporter MFP subunit